MLAVSEKREVARIDFIIVRSIVARTMSVVTVRELVIASKKK